MYKKDEKIILLADKGKEGEKGFLKKGTILSFVEARDVGMKSFVVAKYEDTLLILPEIAVKSSETDYLSVLRDFNKKLIDNSPELSMYHHSGFMRVLYKIRDFFISIFKTKKIEEVKRDKPDLSHIKDMINKGGDIE